MTPFPPSPRRLPPGAGFLTVDMMVAMSMVVLALLPLVFGFSREQALARRYYERTAIMEIVDGEMEILRAGAWRGFGPGTHPVPIRAEAAASLPPGRLELTLAGRRLRLEWRSTGPPERVVVARDAELP